MRVSSFDGGERVELWLFSGMYIETLLKACSNKANIVQLHVANNVAQCWTKILSTFKLKPTSSNIIHHSVQMRPTCCTNNIMLDDVGPTCWLRLNRPQRWWMSESSPRCRLFRFNIFITQKNQQPLQPIIAILNHIRFNTLGMLSLLKATFRVTTTKYLLYHANEQMYLSGRKSHKICYRVDGAL